MYSFFLLFSLFFTQTRWALCVQWISWILFVQMCVSVNANIITKHLTISVSVFIHLEMCAWWGEFGCVCCCFFCCSFLTHSKTHGFRWTRNRDMKFSIEWILLMLTGDKRRMFYKPNRIEFLNLGISLKPIIE